MCSFACHNRIELFYRPKKTRMCSGSILFFGFVVLICIICVACTSSTPKSANSLLISTRNKALLSTAGLAGAVGLKYGYLNGASFTEDVSMAGKTVVITGANTGLGKESAAALSKMGASCILLCKSEEKAQKAIDDIKKVNAMQGMPSDLVSLPLDLADLYSIENCATQLRKAVRHIDVLMLNAGVMAIPERRVTRDGFEMHQGINHLGHFALAGRLLDLVAACPVGGRVISVSSAAHLLSKGLPFDDLMLERPGAYEPWPAYSNSKLSNVLFTRGLARRLAQSSTGGKGEVIASTLHPGVCRTDLGRYLIDDQTLTSIQSNPYLSALADVAALPFTYFTKTPTQGAQTQIYLAASSHVTKETSAGVFFDNNAPAQASPLADDVGSMDRLWTLSEQLTGVKYDFS